MWSLTTAEIRYPFVILDTACGFIYEGFWVASSVKPLLEKMYYSGISFWGGVSSNKSNAFTSDYCFKYLRRMCR